MIEIEPLERLSATVRVPGSKSYTQRAMVIAALAEGESRLRDVLHAEDTELLGRALGRMGTRLRPEGGDLIVAGTAGRLQSPAGEIFLGNNGTAMRLLTAVCALGEGPFVLTGGERLRRRPIRPLLAALASLGAEIRAEGEDGAPPLTIRGGRLKGTEVVLRDIESSQYVSALLIVAPFASGTTRIVLEGRVPSLPYVVLTLEAMRDFGVAAETEGPRCFRIQGGQCYQARDYAIEGDASSASYFFAAAAVCRGRVRVANINPASRQGDLGFLAVLERLGCRIRKGEDYVEVTGGEMPGGEMRFDLGEMPDMVPTLAVLAAVRPGRTVITNVGHLRFKESDRLAALKAELGKTGVAVEELPDGLAITGGSPRGAAIATYDDHRIAMSFAVLGLAVAGMRIEDEGCVGKSFPDFWEKLEKLRQ